MKMQIAAFAIMSWTIMASTVSAQNINKFVISDEAAKKTPMYRAPGQ